MAEVYMCLICGGAYDPNDEAAVLYEHLHGRSYWDLPEPEVVEVNDQ